MRNTEDRERVLLMPVGYGRIETVGGFTTGQEHRNAVLLQARR